MILFRVPHAPGMDFRELPIKLLSYFPRLISILSLRPHDTTTEAGRSKERLRRAALTTVSSGGTRAIGILVSLVTLPLTFKYLGTERYGLWMVLVSIIGAMGFADLGIGFGLMNFISEAYGRDDRRMARESVTSAFVMMVCIALVLAVAGSVAYPFLPWMHLFNVKSPLVAAEGARALVVLYAWFLINIPLGVVTRAQAGLQKGYVSNYIGALGSVLNLIAILIVVKLHGSLPWLVFATTMGSVLSLAFNCWILFHEHPWLVPQWGAFRMKTARRILDLGLMFFVLQIAVTLGYTSDNIVITQVIGIAAVAAYAVPQKLFGFVGMVVNMAVSPLWPAYGEAIARGDVTWVRRVFRASLLLTLAVTVPSCTLFAIAGPWLLRVIMGKSLHVELSVMVVLGVWAIVSSVSNVVSMLLNGASVMKVQAAVGVVSSIINLGLSILFTRRFGVIGVCLGSILTQFLIVHPLYFFLVRDLFRGLKRARVDETSDQALMNSA